MLRQPAKYGDLLNDVMIKNLNILCLHNFLFPTNSLTLPDQLDNPANDLTNPFYCIYYSCNRLI